MHCKDNILRGYSKKNKILNLNLDEFTVNGILSLEKVISKIETDAGKLYYHQIQWPLDDFIFTKCSIQKFKDACLKTLKNLQIILINTPIK